VTEPATRHVVTRHVLTVVVVVVVVVVSRRGHSAAAFPSIASKKQRESERPKRIGPRRRRLHVAANISTTTNEFLLHASTS